MEPLPICRWRREATGEDRHACVSPKLITGPRGVADAKCDTCYCRDHPPPRRPRGPCAYLGPRVAMVSCESCASRGKAPVDIPLHGCEKHQSCTIAFAVDGTKCCTVCNDHSPAWPSHQAGAVRHLMYFIYPFGPSLLWNIQQIRARMSLFNGQRTVAVAVGPETLPFEMVQGLLEGHDIQWLRVVNDPGLREMAAFPILLEHTSKYAGATDCTFYGHAKGATSESWAPGVRKWTTAMYSALLDHWPAVQRELKDHPAVGIFQRLRTGLPESNVKWHYSGSFRWVRNRDLYSRNWREIDHNWCGSEGHVAKHFRSEECACLYGSFGAGGLGLYLDQTWAEWASAERATWEKEHETDKQSTVLCTVILTAHAQPERVHEAIASVVASTVDSWQLLIVDSGRIAASGAYDRYAGDARISVMLSNETEILRSKVGIQAWCINQAWKRGRVRGDLVCHLCDDDVLASDALAVWIDAARQRPDQSAWYRAVDRVQLNDQGIEVLIDQLKTRGIGNATNKLDCKIDGMQVCHRRGARTDWPEEKSEGWHADGLWIDAVGRGNSIHPLPGSCGKHRLTPQSTFTQRIT